MNHLCAAFFLACLAAPAWSQAADRILVPAEPKTAQSAAAEIDPNGDTERVLVVGQRPGPGLWKVSNDRHVLWIFGTHSPLPKNMEWRSRQVEAILANSQEFIGSPSVKAEVGFFRSLTLLPFAIGLKKNPGGAHLRDLLPAGVYARWQLLKQKYIGADDSIERERPFFAAETLFQSGLAHAGLSSGREVHAAIEKIIKQYKIKTTSPEVQLEVKDPVKMVKDFKKSHIDDATCFALTLERLESDIDTMRIRAKAWARGDVDALRKLNLADRDDACTAALINGEFMQRRAGLRSMEAQLLDTWVGAAEKALATNASTFAVLPMRYILTSRGYLAALEAKGYRVEAPE